MRKKSNKGMKLSGVIVMLLFILSSGCKTDQYDLNDNLDLHISMGGDSLALPILNSDRLYLGDILDSMDIEGLSEENDRYSFRFSDSIEAEIPFLEPVVIAATTVSIDPVTTSIPSLDLEEIKIEPFEFQSDFSIPYINTSELKIPKINSVESFQLNLSEALPPFPAGVGVPGDLSIKTGLIKLEVRKTIGQAAEFNYPEELKKINFVYLKNGRVSVTFDKSEVSKLGFKSLNDTLKLLRIDLPPEYKISSPAGVGVSIEGNSLLIREVVLGMQSTTYSASFSIDELNFREITQNSSIYFDKDINYELVYCLDGEIDLTSTIPDEIDVGLKITAEPAVDDLEIVVNEIGIDNFSHSESISERVEVPEEISHIRDISCKDGAYIELKIENPDIAPFVLQGGVLTLQLPQKFIFTPGPNLDVSGKKLTIPYNDLFRSHRIGIAGAHVDAAIPEGNNWFMWNDSFHYSSDNIRIGEATTRLNTINNMSSRKLDVKVSVHDLFVENADITTRRIAVEVPEVKPKISIDELIDEKVEKIYSLAFEQPVEVAIELNFENIPTSVEYVTLNNLSIQFPESLRFRKGDVSEENKLILQEKINLQDGFKKKLFVEKIDFGPEGKALEQGRFVLDDEVLIGGEVFIEQSDINTTELSDVVVHPGIQIGEIRLSEVEFKLGGELDPIEELVNIDLPDKIKGSKIDITDPYLELEFGNTLDVGLALHVALTPKNKPGNSIETVLEIQAAQKAGEITWSRFRLANDTTFKSVGFKGVQADLQGLIGDILDNEIQFVATPTVIGEKQKVIFGAEESSVSVKYRVGLPFSLGEEFRILYNDTITGLAETLSEIMKFTSGKLQVIADVENSLPLQLNFKSEALDSLGREIPNVVITTSGVVEACRVEGENTVPSVSRIKIDIEGKADNLAMLDKLAISIDAKNRSTVSGIALKRDQYIRLQVKVRVPKGVKIDLSDI